VFGVGFWDAALFGDFMFVIRSLCSVICYSGNYKEQRTKNKQQTTNNKNPPHTLA
jgi:hypothetical protein